jgi:hypothetical protein
MHSKLTFRVVVSQSQTVTGNYRAKEPGARSRDATVGDRVLNER